MKKDEVLKLIKKYEAVIDQLPAKELKQVRNFTEELGDRFFTSPASSSKKFHDAEPGGLLSHSLKVYVRVEQICNLWFPEIPKKSRIITGLFHDLGKIGDLEGTNYYVPTTESWKLNKGIVYDVNPAMDDGLTSHAQRSLRLLTKFVDLDKEEYLAILLHDGLYIKENATMDRVHSHSLLMALHWSDYYTVFFDEE